MSRNHLPLTGLAIVITVFAGVMTPGDPEPERSPGIAYLRARLVGDLHNGESGPVDPSRVAFDSMPSRVVPGLMDLEAREPVGGQAAAPAYAVVGVKGAMSRVLREPADLAWIVGAWRPATSRDAIALCIETIALASDARDGRVPPVTVAGTGALPDALTDRSAIADVVVPPVARRVSGDAWKVSLWSVQRGRTRLYECRLGAGADRLGIGLTVVDSVLGAGLAARP